MEHNFSGFVIDPVKCSELSLEEKRGLVHEILCYADNAPEILKSFSRKELLEIICAELGQERKYSGVTKTKMIKHLLRIFTKKNGKKSDDKAVLPSDPSKNQGGTKRKRKNEAPLVLNNTVPSVPSQISKTEEVTALMCQNFACRASLTPDDKYCKRCSCCICHQFDDNKDPSLWLVCSSDPPYCGESCGVSCHLKCALKHEKAGMTKTGCYKKLDGSFYCVCCGKVNWLMGSWRKQLQVAKEARRVDILCDRLSLSHKILKGTELYEEIHEMVNEAMKKLRKELGPLDKVSTIMGRGIVNRLACGAEVQRLCAHAVVALESMLSGTINGLVDTADVKFPGSQAFLIGVEDISPTSVTLSLQSKGEVFKETIIGCTLWHRCSASLDYPQEPTFTVLRPETKFKVCGLLPSTEYYFRASPFSSSRELGRWEANCMTGNLNCVSKSPKKEQELVDQPVTIEADSQRGSTNSSDDNQTPNLTSEAAPVDTPINPSRRTSNGSPDSGNKESTAERQYEYCVKVIRWLECEGYMEKEFRVKFLTWFSLKASAQERRVVSAFIDVLIDEPDSLVAQLADAFMDGICNKKQAVRRGIYARLWH